ncbi:MAG: UDP-N-acetylmuramoyl-L-alanine--D-glutamate ligase [Candidatus Magasanikbacteria bacterium]|nr:UDP-N-acetylmuramoyl-L-alanine--D-glutamate ligase [Candidatus Magasanikbacteria bacterium]
MKLFDFKNDEILILGFGIEGVSTLKFLRTKFPTKKISVYDKKSLKKLEKEAKEAIRTDNNLSLKLEETRLDTLDEYGLVIKSPGVKIANHPSSTNVTSQTELFFNECQGTIIGVTGTKGKSTTSTLIYNILKNAGLHTELIGNIGNPALSSKNIYDKNMYFVYELSSFQLESLKRSPHIAVMLNIFPEHLDYHGSFKDYKDAKLNIIKFQKKNDYIVFNNDQEVGKKIAVRSKAIKLPFSLKTSLANGVYKKDKKILFSSNAKIEEILDTKKVQLLGEFNQNNVLAAVAVGKLLKIPSSSIAKSIYAFKGLEHRLQFIREINKVRFYNDSISTIPQATIAALEALGNKVDTLILGGYDRGQDFSELAKIISAKKIQNLVFFPTTGKKILEEIKSINFSPKYIFTSSMSEAVKFSKENTKSGKVCLLSPASPSFGVFKNYKDRGYQFIKMVNSL